MRKKNIARRSGKSEGDRTSRWLSSQTASAAHSILFLGNKDREKNSLQYRTAGPVLTALAMPRRAERNARPERKDDLISRVFPSHPCLIFSPHAYAYASPSHSYATHATDYPDINLKHFHSSRWISTGTARRRELPPPLLCLAIRNSGQKHSNRGWRQSDRRIIRLKMLIVLKFVPK